MISINRRSILEAIFGWMPERLDASGAGELHAVVRWEFLDDTGAASTRFQVTIRAGECTVAPMWSDEPDVTFTIEAADFLKLVTGVVPGPTLFVEGRLRIEGDLALAARMPGLFGWPTA